MMNQKTRALKNSLLASFALMGGLAMGLLSGCTPLVHHQDPVLFNANVHSVYNETKLKDLVAAATAEYQSNWFNGIGGVAEDTNGSQTMSPGVEGGGVTRDYTDTNTQVDGVAEGDIVKTDGYNIYYAARYENKIRVLSVSDDHSISLESTIDLGEVYTDSLYLTSNYLIIIGYRYNIQETTCRYSDAEGDAAYCLSYMWWQPTGTVVVIDRATLLPVYTLETDSYFMDNRLIDDSLFLVGYKYLYGNGEEELRPTFTEIKDGTSVEAVVGYDSLYYFDDTPAYGMRVLTGIKLNDDPSLIEYNASGYLGASPDYQKMYVSLNALYLAETVYHYDNTTSYTRMTISQYNIDIPNATMEFRASGIVEGTSLNQFSMDEYEGYLRVATTNRVWTWSETSNVWWDWMSNSVTTNHLYILKVSPTAHEFDLIGHMSEGLGKPNESIQSVRFSGNTAYVVTFLRTDPLYIIDLSEPTTPIISGTIEQEGYDTYQHPWGDGRLVGIGYDADENGMVTGLKISAYNTALGTEETIQTKVLSTYGASGENTWSYGYSEALWNPKALLVSVEHGIIAFSVQAYEYGYTTNPTSETSSEDPTSTDGDVTTSSETTPADGSSAESTGNTDGYESWYWTYHSYYYIFQIDFENSSPISDPIIIEHPTSQDYYVNVDRGILIDGYVYTISNREVIVYSLVDKEIFGSGLTF